MVAEFFHGTKVKLLTYFALQLSCCGGRKEGIAGACLRGVKEWVSIDVGEGKSPLEGIFNTQELAELFCRFQGQAGFFQLLLHQQRDFLGKKVKFAPGISDCNQWQLQHLALKVNAYEDLVNTKAKLEAAGIEVVGPTDHTIFKSIYFFDPNGHRLELAWDCGTPQMMQKLDEVKWDMLNEWSQTRRAPRHAAWMHDGSLSA